MSTQIQSGEPLQGGTWTKDGGSLLSQPFLNFFARRRVAISLIGFVGLMLFNLLVRQTVPLNPFALANPLVILALCLLVIGLLIRSWSAGTLNKSREVTRHGPYAITRNPLYIGSFLMMFGFCILLRDLPTLIFVAGPMAALYWLQVRFEEKRLLFMFPGDWQKYTASVPRFVPRLLTRGIPPEAFHGWTHFEWLRNREYKAILSTVAALIATYVWHLVSPSIW